MNQTLRILLSGIAVCMAALAQPKIDAAFSFSQAKPGTDVTIPGTGFPTAPTGIALTVQPRGLQITAKSAAPTALVFTLPALDPGDYTAIVAFPPDPANPALNKPVQVPGTLSIPKPATAAESPKTSASISGVAPSTAYSNKDRFTFDIYGENFPDPNKTGTYLLQVSGRIISPIEVQGSGDECTNAETACLKWIAPEHLLVSGIQRADVYQWKTQVQLRVNNVWIGPKTLIFSKWQRHWPFLAAGFFVAASFLIILLVFHRKPPAAAAAKYNVVTRFLLDADTNSYSLSKFQVFAWLTIIVFAYVYVLFCRITIQGIMEWPEFPGTLAGMFGLSLGSMVAATAVSGSKGNKGAGAADPSFADFFSTGGVVAADRFQFFLWTLVGFFGYLSLLWFSDPTNIAVVPTVPEGLLYLMGVSAGGYVGGKLARNPGPNITGLKVSVESPSNEIHLRILGDNLSPAATYQIDMKEVKTVVRPVTVVTPAPGKPNFATELDVVITAPDPAWLTGGPHTLRLINDDGQFAEKPYSIAIVITGAVTKAAAAGGMAITIPALALAPSIATVDLEVKDSTATAFKVPGIAPAAPPAPTVVNVPGANPAGQATVVIRATDGSSVKVTVP